MTDHTPPPSTAASEFTLAEMIAAVKHEAGIEYLNIAYAKEQQHHERVLTAVVDLLSRLSAGEGGPLVAEIDNSLHGKFPVAGTYDRDLLQRARDELAARLWKQRQAAKITEAERATKSAVDRMHEAQTERAHMEGRALQAEAKLAEAERDARRYRWLRNLNVIYDDQPSIRIGPYWHAPLCWGDAADSAIDAAMEAKGE